MPVPLLYAREKYSEAVYILATHPGHVKNRLRHAWIPIWGIIPGFGIEEVGPDIEWIHQQLSRFPAEGCSPVLRTIAKIHYATAQRIVVRIVNVHGILDHLVRAKRELDGANDP